MYQAGNQKRSQTSSFSTQTQTSPMVDEKTFYMSRPQKGSMGTVFCSKHMRHINHTQTNIAVREDQSKTLDT